MSVLSDKAGTAAMMKNMDRKAIEEYGIPGIVLMENAGRGAFQFIMEHFEPEKAAVFAGKGNNGGDGYVIARHLINWGVHTDVYLLAARDEIKGDARVNLDMLYKMGAPVFEVKDTGALDDFRYHVEQADLIVDAILGTGIDKEVKRPYSDFIEFINSMAEEDPGKRVFSVDLPSGLNADNGQVMGAAVAAHATATFGMVKTGQLSFPGASLVGTLALVDISLPQELYADIPYAVVTPGLAAELIPERSEDAHKGHTGHGVVLAGSPGKTGAAVMAAESAMRTGAGLITLAGPAGLHHVLETKTLEVMTEPLPDTDTNTLGPASADRALELLEGKTAAALGPGIGRSAEVTEFVRRVLEGSKLPLVIDADGLNAISDDVKMLERASCPLVLTPHPGEMARLTGMSTKEVLADRLNVALKFAADYNAVLVLKGAHSITATPEGRAYFNLTGNPGMASGGMGDVLTGAVLGLMCQGMSPENAALLAVYLHGAAGDLAAEELGEEGMMAGDVMDLLPEAMLELRQGALQEMAEMEEPALECD